MTEKMLTEQVETAHRPANALREMIESVADGRQTAGDGAGTGREAGADGRETDPDEGGAGKTGGDESGEGETDPDEDGADETDEADGGDEALTLEPPAHWSLDDQTMFRAQSREAQQWLLDRSKAMDATHTRRSQEIAPLRGAVDKWSGYLGQLGATPEQAFDMLIAAEYQLRTGTPEQKRAAMTQLARDYDIEPPAGAPATPHGQDEGDDGDDLAADIREAVAPIAEQVD